MALIKAEISDELDRKFRKTVMDRYGYRKGSLKAAITNAIEVWIDIPNTKLYHDTNVKRQINNLYQQSSHPYIALKDGKVVASTQTLKELWMKLSNNPDEKYSIVGPNMQKSKKVRLGWRSSLKVRK